MEYLSWDLSVLSRAVAYSNLSGASAHVGLSQPQLSRIVAKLEDQLGLVLLDRETKRKSSWTPAAYRLAEVYTKTFQKFRAEVNVLVEGAEPDHLRIAALEGVIPVVLKFCRSVYENTTVSMIELNIYDTSAIEEKFFKGELDLIYTFREPGRKKFRFQKLLGYQSLDHVNRGESDMKVMSSFEFATQMAVHKDTKKERVFVSNSLRVRRDWLDSSGGSGILPSELRQKKGTQKNEVPLIVIAQEHTPPNFWKKISTYL